MSEEQDETSTSPKTKKFQLKARGYTGRSIFDPHLRKERRIWDISAESADEVRQMFNDAVERKVEHVMGAGVPFEIESIEEIT